MDQTPEQMTSQQICRAIKEPAEQIREVLIGIFGDSRQVDMDDGLAPHRTGRHFPADVCQAAYDANCRLNAWILEDFGRLHAELNLGPRVMLGTKCEHED